MADDFHGNVSSASAATTERSSGTSAGAGGVLTRDLMMGEFIAATSATEEVGEVLEDLGRFGVLLREHGKRQLSIGQRYVKDIAQVRSIEQFLAVQLHAMRTTFDNQLGFIADAARLQADGINRTRHSLAVGFATLERTLAGRPAAQDHGPKH